MELQNRLDDTMWLVKHLERTRLLVLDDLIVVKVLLLKSDYLNGDDRCDHGKRSITSYIQITVFFFSFCHSRTCARLVFLQVMRYLIVMSKCITRLYQLW